MGFAVVAPPPGGPFGEQRPPRPPTFTLIERQNGCRPIIVIPGGLPAPVREAAAWFGLPPLPLADAAEPKSNP